ncbi:MAG: hypothetical protein A2X16_00510 [Bacteroidetes bacterium GWF2_39_10]|nr:MAG: hypothetical protein A2X16_00510 [Bacteroidetes bacterium GWF2_39_10]
MNKMKIWSLMCTLILVIAIATGCGNAKKAEESKATSQNTEQNANGNNQRQFNQSPDAKLGRTIMSIERIQRSENVFTKEQTEKLLPLLKEIKAKESVDEAYANKKSDEISAIFTQAQKDSMTQRPGNFNRNQGNGNPSNNTQLNRQGQGNGNSGNNMQMPRDGQRNGGNNPNQGRNGGSFDLKSICDRAIEALQK